VTDVHFWSSAIAIDLFFGGIGVGTFLFAVLLSSFYKSEFKLASRAAAIITPLSVAVGFTFLLAHLGHPERFYIVYMKFRITSPLWWGAWLQAVFFIISVLYAWLWLKERRQGLRRILGYTGVPFALSVGVYHGFLLMVFKSKPLWNTGPTTLAAICGFITTGVALVVLILTLVPDRKMLLKELRVSRNILGAAIAIQLLTLALWLSSLFFGPAESHAAMLRLVGDYGGWFWGGAVVVGLVVPLGLGGIAIGLEKRTGRFSYFIPFVTSLLVLVGGLSLRYVVIVAA
jgi:protein NrfD